MATGTQLVKIHRSSDGAVLYTATTRRNTDNYPLNSTGDAAFGQAASNGSFELRVQPSGPTIPVNTIPPLNPWGGGSTSFYEKIQSEVGTHGSPGKVTGTGSQDGNPNLYGDDVMMGQFITSSDYLDYHLESIPITGDYHLDIRYQTNTQAQGTATVIVFVNGNQGTPQDFHLDGAEGGKRTAGMTVHLQAGSGNVIRVQGKEGTTMFQDYIIVSSISS
ncbi:hypothetical protein [Spirosoma sp. 48-14]|uniref:hypothetical protein n=1 Tax=Spirosoma sp. 48-14 TaxID=1895854 RepID=UPI00095AA9CB|nr:hypothetical protein [Spirosoma sp. 48-14]OJW70504.1 MAG: hypothetical protein BGO59_24995 [Spirosoma sp. 48-14]